MYGQGNINQCREIYEKYIFHHPSNSEVWIKYAEMEVTVKENIRAKEIYELAIKQVSNLFIFKLYLTCISW